MLYGLEISKLRHSDTMQLEALQRSVVYCLLGVRPVEQEIDFRILSLLISIIYSENTIESELAKRQMAVKDSDGNSWFIHCNQLLQKYNLPNIYNLKQHSNSKETLKEEI